MREAFDDNKPENCSLSCAIHMGIDPPHVHFPSLRSPIDYRSVSRISVRDERRGFRIFVRWVRKEIRFPSPRANPSYQYG